MSSTDPYAKLGGGALDQELFRKKSAPSVKDAPGNEPQEKPVTDSPAPQPITLIKRKQISAYLSPEQVQTLKSLHFSLNSNSTIDKEIEKSDIVALGIGCVSLLISTQVPQYANIQELRTAVLDKVSQYLGTQVPET